MAEEKEIKWEYYYHTIKGGYTWIAINNPNEITKELNKFWEKWWELVSSEFVFHPNDFWHKFWCDDKKDIICIFKRQKT